MEGASSFVHAAGLDVSNVLVRDTRANVCYSTNTNSGLVHNVWQSFAGTNNEMRNKNQSNTKYRDKASVLFLR